MGLVFQLIGITAMGLGVLGLQIPIQATSSIYSPIPDDDSPGVQKSANVFSRSLEAFAAAEQLTLNRFRQGSTIPGGSQLGMSRLANASICPPPALSQLIRHTIAAGETIEAIAQQYGLLPGALLGMNPTLRQGDVPVGAEIVIPPYNGIQVEVLPGQTWAQIAAVYNVQADVLFEINGCQAVAPATIFIPGVNWFPGLSLNNSSASSPAPLTHELQGYPLPEPAAIISNYGWQPHPSRDELVFNSGIALAAVANTPVLAVGEGVVAFSGQQEGYGNLVVINHRQGLQTRYANLTNLMVRSGQTISQFPRSPRRRRRVARPD